MGDGRFGLRVVAVTEQHDLEALLLQGPGQLLDLPDYAAGTVDDPQPQLLGPLVHRRALSVGSKDEGGA